MSIENQLVDLMKDELDANLNSILTDSEIKTIEDIRTVADWYQEARQGKEDFLLKSLNIIVEKIMEYVVPELVNQLIDEIKINTKNHETNVKFSFNFELMPIKPFIIFIKKINEIPSLKIKTVFQIDCNGTMEDVEILARNNERMIGLNNILMAIELSLFLPQVAAINFEESKKLGARDFTLDCSKIKMPY